MRIAEVSFSKHSSCDKRLYSLVVSFDNRNAEICHGLDVHPFFLAVASSQREKFLMLRSSSSGVLYVLRYKSIIPSEMVRCRYIDSNPRNLETGRNC